MALTEATGKVSQHIFRKNGFADRFSVAYSNFRYENRLVFASICGHEEAILMDRSLTAKGSQNSRFELLKNGFKRSRNCQKSPKIILKGRPNSPQR